MRNRIPSLLLILSAAGAAWSLDSTLVYKQGHMEGRIRLYAGARQVEASLTEIQAVRFDLGQNTILTLRNIGLPDFNASCNATDFSALIAEQAQGVSGFKGAADTAWAQALVFPTRLTPLDSVPDRYPEYTKRNAFAGMGWIHSGDVSIGCKTTQQSPQQGFRRIFYYRANRGVYIKAQVDGFETEDLKCEMGPGVPCTRLKYLSLRYAVTDAEGGLFSDPASVARPAKDSGRYPAQGPGLIFRQAFPRPIWEYVLGRTL
ncbi:MAG: hypothetical protein JWP91_3079 [Fibrobacteres bacterium]|nr:hypothetical protein [Fibrobacterota bacterium]